MREQRKSSGIFCCAKKQATETHTRNRTINLQISTSYEENPQCTRLLDKYHPLIMPPFGDNFCQRVPWALRLKMPIKNRHNF
jgi:hypothetical protein